MAGEKFRQKVIFVILFKAWNYRKSPNQETRMTIDSRCYVIHDQRNHQISIGNDRIERVFRYDPRTNGFFTCRLSHKTNGVNWSVSETREFQIAVESAGRRFELNNQPADPQGQLRFEQLDVTDLPDGGKQLHIIFQAMSLPLRIRLFEEIHPGCDWIRRWLGIENNTQSPLAVVEYNPECLGVISDSKGFYFNSWRWGSRAYVRDFRAYAGIGIHSFHTRDRVFEPATVPTDSPLLLTDNGEKEFLWYFPEVPIRSVVVREDPQPLIYSRNPWDETIEPGRSVDFTAGVVVGVGAGSHRDGFRSFRSYLDRWVAGDNIAAEKTAVVYNTWYGEGYTDSRPNEDNCLRQIELSRELGAEMYVVDAGWHDHFGDWNADPAKFPRGLSVISDACHKRGMKFGLWIDSRIACACSRLFQSHPDWAVKKQEGSLYRDNLAGHDIAAMCMASDYGEYLKQLYVRLVTELQLDCLKIDNVCLLGYYSFWSPCFDEHHGHAPGASHKAVWEKWIEILDAVRQARPGILIESIPSGLSLLGKHHLIWAADYQYRPDWMREAYFYRALMHHMAATHPPAAIHQGWASADCLDLKTLDYLCASTLGAAAQSGVTGAIELASDANKAVLKKWIAWSKENRKYLNVYQPLFENRPPMPIETVEDDVYMESPAWNWKPDHVDGFAHLLPDGGWVFLFNPTDVTKSVRLKLSLMDYKVRDFSAVTAVGGFNYDPANQTLELNQTLEPGGYSQSRIYAGFPVGFKSIRNQIIALDWNESARRLEFVCSGPGGQYKAELFTNGSGRPAVVENAQVVDYDPVSDTLTLLCRSGKGMDQGSLLAPVVLRWPPRK
jgi:hypothetical protein